MEQMPPLKINENAPKRKRKNSFRKGIRNALSIFDELLENVDLSGPLREELRVGRRKMQKYVENTQENAKQMLRNLQTKTADRVKIAFRRAIVGDPDESLRAYLSKTSTIKWMDEFSFSFSLLNCAFLEFLVLIKPEWLSIYYVCLLSSLLVARYYFYSSLNYQYFLLDLCYAVNGLCCVQIGLFKLGFSFPRFNTVLFVMVSGPVLWGIVVWRNSMVFHSIDKMTSMFIHLLPALYVYISRWHMEQEFHEMDFKHWVVYPCSVWWLWQICYQIKTELIDNLDEHPEIITSLTWLSSDPQNFMNKLTLSAARPLGIFGPEENFDSKNIKTKIVFIMANFFYFCVVIAPCPIFFHSWYAHIIMLITVLVMSIINGGSYYIKVFSSRYYSKLEKRAAELQSTLSAMTPNILEEAQRRDSELLSEFGSLESEQQNEDSTKSEEAKKDK